MTVVFNDSIFISHFNFHPYQQINVFNNADKFLVDKAGLPTSSSCRLQVKGREQHLSSSKILNINPKNICRGTNLYTLNMRNKRLTHVAPFSPITVYDDNVATEKTATPLVIGEFHPELLYDVNFHLSSFESAVMLKYYATNNDNVHITRGLFTFASRHFNSDKRKWFSIKSDKRSVYGIVQTKRKELVSLHTGEILNNRYVKPFFSEDKVSLVATAQEA